MWRSLAICLIATLLTASWLSVNSTAVVAPWLDIPPAGQRLASWLHNPMQFPALLGHAYVAGAPDLFSSLFAFGWLNVFASSAAVFLSLLALGLVLLAGDPEAARLRWNNRLWLAGLALTIPLLLALVAWLYWTPSSMNSISGLQGRYFIPIAPALLIAILPSRKVAISFSNLVPVLMIGANLFALVSIARAFYTF